MNACRMVRTCLGHQMTQPWVVDDLVSYEVCDGVVNLQYGSVGEHGELVPNAGLPYFMKLLSVHFYPEAEYAAR